MRFLEMLFGAFFSSWGHFQTATGVVPIRVQFISSVKVVQSVHIYESRHNALHNRSDPDHPLASRVREWNLHGRVDSYPARHCGDHDSYQPDFGHDETMT
jgi:hypothetical protein